jgi:hypothetical protein
MNARSWTAGHPFDAGMTVPVFDRCLETVSQAHRSAEHVACSPQPLIVHSPIGARSNPSQGLLWLARARAVIIGERLWR